MLLFTTTRVPFQLSSRLSAVFVEVLFFTFFTSPFLMAYCTDFGRGCLGSASQTSVRCEDVTQPLQPLQTSLARVRVAHFKGSP